MLFTLPSGLKTVTAGLQMRNRGIVSISQFLKDTQLTRDRGGVRGQVSGSETYALSPTELGKCSMGTPGNPTRRSWSLLEEDSNQGRDLEAPKQRGHSEAPNSSTLGLKGPS